MTNHPRRVLAAALCAVLVAGLVPPQAAAAAAVAIEAGAARAPLSAAAGAAAVGGSPALVLASPAPLTAPALPASVVVSAAASPSAAPSATRAAATSEDAPTASATPAASAPETPASASAPETPASAGTPADAAQRQDAPAAAVSAPAAAPAPAPVAARSWRARAKAWWSGGEVGAAAAAEGDKPAADKVFDGSATRPETAPAPASADGLRAQAKVWSLARLEAYQARRAIGHDDFGGPKPVVLSWRGRVVYGVQRGMNLVGLAALAQLIVGPLFTALKWPLRFSADHLHWFGRVELLARYGPAEIAEWLSHSPLRFLAIHVPLTTAGEELTYRFFGFGLTFGLLALAKPVTRKLADLLDQIPNAAGQRSLLQRALRGAGAVLSHFAFPAAALSSAYSFAAAHFEHWGVSPVVFAVNLAAGYVLAHTAYKTRGLTAPFVAHLTFNLSVLGGMFLLFAVHLPLAAAAYGLLVSAAGLYSLWRFLRTGVSGRGGRLLRRIFGGLLFVAAFNAVGMRPQSRTAAAPAAPLPEHDTSGLVLSLPRMGVAQPASPAPAPAVAPAPAEALAPEPADMIAKVKPTVVQITVRMSGGYALGSGVIIAPDGRVVTNAHVVGDRRPGQEVSVELVGGTKVAAKILAVNHDRDLAFLQLPPAADGHPWPASAFAARDLREGDPVYAMGHPRGLPFTVTHGIVSGLDARGNMYIQYLQTDAAINPGNSGGPLFNARGEIVGINTMIYTKSGGSEGLGFSIVTPSIVSALAQYDKTGNMGTAALGIVVNLSDPAAPDAGLAVEFVRPGSAADKAGLRRGDLLLAFNGQTIKDGGTKGAEELAAVLAKAEPGSSADARVLRHGAPLTLTVRLDAKPTSEETSSAHDFDNPTP